MTKKILRVELKDKNAKAPRYANEGDAGLDLFSPIKIKIPAKGKVIIDTKVAIHLPKNTVALVWDKGSLGCKYAIKVLGGVFDENYRGTFTIGLANLSSKAYQVEKGDKICQVLIQKIEYVNVKVVKNIDTNTVRGPKRFGSTGRS